MSIIERMKNCEGCRKRRRWFLKKLGQAVVGLGLATILPRLAKAGCGDCRCILCPSDGSWICLCCESQPCNCADCFFIQSSNSITVCTPCPTGYKCFGVGCDGYCPPKVTCVKSDAQPMEHFLYYWQVTLTNDAKIIVGADDPGFDIMTHFSAGTIKVTDKDDKRVWAKATKRLPESPKA